MPRSANPVPQYFDNDNKILSGGKVFYFDAGTSSPKTTYSDEGETIANPHPVILDAAGRLPNVFFTGTAKQILKDLNDVQIWERDNVGSVEQISDFNSYDENISYDAGDIVKFNGLFYISLQNSNQNNQPDANLDFWNEIRFIELYNVNIDYPLGLVVQTSNGNLWKSVNTPNQGNDPSVDDGTNWRASIGDDLTLDSLVVTGLSDLDEVTANNIDSVLLKRAASTVYARDDVVGSVSELVGSPTGAVVERGSNANGQYTAFADGTVLMWTTVNISSTSTNAIWTFPWVDSSLTFLQVNPTIDQALQFSVRIVTGTITSPLTYSFAVVDETATTVASVPVQLSARGRWF